MFMKKMPVIENIQLETALKKVEAAQTSERGSWPFHSRQKV